MKLETKKKIGIVVCIIVMVIGVAAAVIYVGNFGPKIAAFIKFGPEKENVSESTQPQEVPVVVRSPFKPDEMRAVWLDCKIDCNNDDAAVNSALANIAAKGFNSVIFSACSADKLAQYVLSADTAGLFSVIYTDIADVLGAGRADTQAVTALVGTGVDSVLLFNFENLAAGEAERAAKAINAAAPEVFVGAYVHAAAEYEQPCDANTFDYKYVDIKVPTSAVKGDYAAFLANYIDGTTPFNVFGIHAELVGNAEGYENPGEIITQFETVTQLDYYGFGFYRYGVLAKNEKGLTDAITDFMLNGIKHDFFKQLTIAKPDSTTVNTNQSVISFVGTGDVAYPLKVNGDEIKMTDDGYFVVEKKLKTGKNQFTFTHKDKSVTYTVNYALKLINSVLPTGAINAPGGTAIDIVAVAYKNAVVKATVNGKTISLIRSDDYDENDIVGEGSDFTYFVGSYTLPAGSTNAKNIGSIKVTASYSGLTSSATGASITVNAKEQSVPITTPETTVTATPVSTETSAAPVTDESGSTVETSAPPETSATTTTEAPTSKTDLFNLLSPKEFNGVSGKSKMIIVSKAYAETFPSTTADDVSVPYFSPLLPGTVDYVTGTSTYDGLKYYVLASGRRVYQSDVTYLASGYNMPSNEIRTVGVTKTAHASNIVLTMKWKVPFNVQELPQSYYTQTAGRPYSIKSYTADYVDIKFYYTGAVGAAPQFSSNIVSRTEWIKNNDGSYTLRLRLKKTGGFYGIQYHYNSDNTLTLSIKERANSSVAGKVVMLDAGHGGNDPGAIGVAVVGSRYVYEATINLSIANKMKASLEALGATVVMTRTSANQSISLDERAAKCRAQNPDIFIAVHCDASGTSASASGTTAYYYKSYSFQLAKYLSENIVRAYKNKIYNGNSAMAAKVDKGAKFKGFRVTRIEECPTVLIEFGFVTNVTECNVLVKDANQSILAAAAVDGIVAYFKNS